MREHRHFGARALPASPESKNTDQRNQWLGLCSWVPGSPVTGGPGMTREFFSTLLVLLRFAFLRGRTELADCAANQLARDLFRSQPSVAWH